MYDEPINLSTPILETDDRKTQSIEQCFCINKSTQMLIQDPCLLNNQHIHLKALSAKKFALSLLIIIFLNVLQRGIQSIFPSYLKQHISLCGKLFNELELKKSSDGSPEKKIQALDHKIANTYNFLSFSKDKSIKKNGAALLKASIENMSLSQKILILSENIQLSTLVVKITP